MNRQEQLDKLLAEGDGLLQTPAANMLKIRVLKVQFFYHRWFLIMY